MIYKIITVVASIFAINAAVASEFDPASITVSASSVLEEGSLTGEQYKVNETVTVSGHMNHYLVDSEFGEFTAIGNFGLKKLKLEIDAIAKLKKMTSTDTGVAAATGVVVDTGKSVSAIVTNPVGTVKGMSSGVSRFFKRTSRQAKDLGKKAGETLSQDDETGDDVDQENEVEAIDETEEGKGTSDVSKKLASSYLGVNKAHRELARELQVDPYSKNEVLQAELNRVAKVSGSVGKFTKILLPIPSFVGTAKSVSNMVWNLSPLDLLIQNEEMLEGAGYEQEEIEAFFSNEAYTPTQQTILTSILVSLKKIDGKEFLLTIAGSAETQVEVEFIIRSLLFTKLHHENIEPVTNLLHSPDRLATVAITESGGAVIFAPLDHLLWTEDVAFAIQGLNELVGDHDITGKKVIWIEGQISDKALAGLEAAGWIQSSEKFKILEEMAGQKPTG